jgi:hypothetical protein
MMKNSLLILILLLGTISFSQAQSEAVVLSDTIYFLDGRKSMPTNILQGWEDREHFSTKRSFESEIIIIPKSEVHYIFNNEQFHLINETSPHDDIQRLRKNLQRYQKQSNLGWSFVGGGAALLLIGQISAESQANKLIDGKIDEINDLPKFLSYAGYGFIAVGAVISIDAGKFLKRGTVDITPVGVRVNF